MIEMVKRPTCTRPQAPEPSVVVTTVTLRVSQIERGDLDGVGPSWLLARLEVHRDI
jgi:hypothetical protein